MKLLEIGSYPPPSSGWSVRVKYLKEAFSKKGHDCKVLNLGKYRKIKSHEYIDIQNGIDYLKKLILFRLRGYHFHVHMNAQALKGPLLSLAALIISLLTFERAAITFHGGIEQLYFPKRNAKIMFWIIYLNFLLSGRIICNYDPIREEIVGYGPLIKRSKIHPIPAFSTQYLDYLRSELPENLSRFIQEKEHIILCYIVLRNGFFIETLIDFLKTVDMDTGIILSGIREVEDEEVSNHYVKLRELEDKGVVLTVNDLDHHQFMTLLEKTDIYLRTPVSDGVASSVLEALSLKVPVVASENGRRPESVITYEADNADDLKEKVSYVLKNKAGIKKGIVKPVIRDTIRDEMEILKRSFLNEIPH